MTSFKIGQRLIGADAPPFIIAEMSGNHNQSLELALQIVEAAAKAGAHALKLQTYTAETMTLDLDEGEFFIQDPTSLWAGSSLYALYEKAHTPWEWHAPIFARARELGMLAFSTPFDETAVDFLESLDVPAYKIASFENTDLPLIRRVAATGKPLIMSTGMASVAELDESVRAARAAGCQDLILLKCTSTYPASPANSHVRTIPHLRELFGCQVGLSDHSMGVGVAVAAVALGATVVEKHFTLDRAAGGVDSSFSLEPAELASLVLETERAWQALGQVHYGVTEAERKSLVYRRSLYVTRDMAAGETFSADNLRAIRPGLGLAPRHLDAVLGRSARQALKRGTPLAWSLVE
ncbi:pseudaminic acid synthase [Pseudomonas sp. MWU13-2100]|uniref:pseudaminic acid synthase n=1 Tax=Pseudomonas sp. MWU13-2100 TaxID=2935075 RepID=UPI00200CAAD5|nr:pseudaminic acid synthase [Pseudomonas sp. MWU13-2100]